MYQRGKTTIRSRGTAIAAAMVVTVGAFSLVPAVNRIKIVSRSGEGGLNVVATSQAIRGITDQDPSSSIQASSLELDTWESVPDEFSLKPRFVVNESQGVEIPDLEELEKSDEDHRQFVFDVDDLDFKPSPYYRKSPVYPFKLRQEGVEGKVFSEFQVDHKGHTLDIRIIESDHEEFSTSVVEALAMWRFPPGRVDGKTVEVRVRIPMRFRLRYRHPTAPELFVVSVD